MAYVLSSTWVGIRISVRNWRTFFRERELALYVLPRTSANRRLFLCVRELEYVRSSEYTNCHFAVSVLAGAYVRRWYVPSFLVCFVFPFSSSMVFAPRFSTPPHFVLLCFLMHSPLSTQFVVATSHRHNSNQQENEKNKKKKKKKKKRIC
jgi:hypothetical protein